MDAWREGERRPWFFLLDVLMLRPCVGWLTPRNSRYVFCFRRTKAEWGNHVTKVRRARLDGAVDFLDGQRNVVAVGHGPSQGSAATGPTAAESRRRRHLLVLLLLLRQLRLWLLLTGRRCCGRSEIQRRAVDTIALAGGLRPVGEQVT